MTPGLPYQDPVDLNTSTPQDLTLRLVAERTQFDISGKKVWGDSYNGDYVGPTMHFTPGEHVTLTLVNKLATPTNLHFHGMHMTPSGAGDNPFISVPPGTTFTYNFDIPLDQPLGTFWYHDHEMCTGNQTMNMPGMPATTPMGSCADTESQIFAGLSGAIVVSANGGFGAGADQGLVVHTMVFKDMQIDKTGQIVQNQGLVSINSNNPTVRLVNGQLQPVLTMLPGQTELWRLTNAGADIFYDLHLDGYTFTVVAQDGYPAAVLTTATTLLLPPGKRYDVLVSASSHPGDAWLQTLPYSNGPGGDSYPAVNLLRLHVAGEASPTASTPPAAEAGWATSTAGTSLAAAPIAQSRTVTLSENAAGTVMYINGKQFDPNKSIFSTPAILGTVEQWTVLNTTGEVHPFHLHTDHFQVMSIAGVAQPYVGQQDTIPVPYEQNGTPGQVVIRIAFTDFTGRLMFHCHIAAHEDSGMMSFINVDQPPAGFDKRLMWNAGP